MSFKSFLSKVWDSMQPDNMPNLEEDNNNELPPVKKWEADCPLCGWVGTANEFQTHLFNNHKERKENK